MSDVARQLTITIDDLTSMLFGLTLTPLEGSAHAADLTTRAPRTPPALRVV